MVKPRVLIVDDSDAVREDFRKILLPRSGHTSEELARLGAELFGEPSLPRCPEFELEVAAQGEEALVLVQKAIREQTPFAAAFVDMRMPPGWSGVETATRLWEVDPRLQVIFCTAYSDYSWERLLASLGASDRWVVLKKPFDSIEVRQLAQSLCSRSDLLRAVEQQVEVLDALVAQRTAELEQANARLSVELTERARIDRELRRVQKLQALGRMAAGIGHEINNPLTYVVANLEYLEGALARGETDQLREGLADIRTGVERIRDIVGELRVFSRMDDGDDSPAELSKVLGSAAKLVAGELRDRATLVEELGGLPLVCGSPGRLEQVFVNLLLNAAQAIEPGHLAENRVTVRARRLSEDWVEVEISDTGVGIPPEIQDHIFEPFFTTKPAGQGTGLGLSISQHIVSELGGRISLQSTSGRGTRVSVLLPVARRGASESGPPASQPA